MTSISPQAPHHLAFGARLMASVEGRGEGLGGDIVGEVRKARCERRGAKGEVRKAG
jgi:hypothetical protein